MANLLIGLPEYARGAVVGLGVMGSIQMIIAATILAAILVAVVIALIFSDWSGSGIY